MTRRLADIVARVWWLAVPHWFRSSGQFASGICRRCGRLNAGWHW